MLIIYNYIYIILFNILQLRFTLFSWVVWKENCLLGSWSTSVSFYHDLIPFAYHLLGRVLTDSYHNPDLKQQSPHTNMWDKDLKLKLTVFLALIAASRCSELKYFTSGFMKKLNEKYFSPTNKALVKKYYVTPFGF